MEQGGTVAAIIVNWNQKELLRQAVDSLLASDYPNLKIIVVDNGSQDGSTQLLTSAYPSVELIALPANVGFAHGNNIGLQMAIERGADFVFLLNNDATVTSTTVSRLKRFLDEHSNAVAVAPYIMYSSQPELIWYGGGRVQLWCGLVAHKHIRKNIKAVSPSSEQTGYLTGCSFLVRSSVIQKTGGFSPEFGLYAEDVDLSLRLIANGGQLWVEPAGLVYHQISASSGGELTPFKGYHRGRSLALLLKKWGKVWFMPTMFGGTILLIGAFTMKMLLNDNLHTGWAVWRGLLAGVFGCQVPVEYKLVFETNMKEYTNARTA